MRITCAFVRQPIFNAYRKVHSYIFVFLFFASNAELDRDWVVLLSSEPRAESEKVKLNLQIGHLH